MVKRRILKMVMLLQVIVLAMAVCSCEEGPVGVFGELPPMIGADGGIVTGLNGDVMLSIPPGALSEDVRFVIHEWLNKSGMNESGFLKTFVIEPYLTFDLPVQLTVKCQGCLENGSTLNEGMSVFFLMWDNPAAYCTEGAQCCSNCCCIEMPSNSVSSCIGKTGVIATVAEQN